jgi:hypothetical protein
VKLNTSALNQVCVDRYIQVDKPAVKDDLLYVVESAWESTMRSLNISTPEYIVQSDWSQKNQANFMVLG